MIATIVSLVLAATLLLIGLGDKLAAEMRLTKIKLLLGILVVIIAVVIPPHVGEDFRIDYGGLVMLVAAFALCIARVRAKNLWKNAIGIILIAATMLLYRYYIPEVMEDAIFGSLFAVVLALTGYITSRYSYDIIINLTMGIGLGQAMMYMIGYYQQDLVIGGSADMIILTVISAILLRQIVMTLSRGNNDISKNRNKQ